VRRVSDFRSGRRDAQGGGFELRKTEDEAPAEGGGEEEGG